MTQSLRRLAEARGGCDAPPSPPHADRRTSPIQDREAPPAHPETEADSSATATLPAEVVPEPRPPLGDEPTLSAREASRPPAIRPRKARQQYRPLDVPPAVARLRDAILNDLGRPDGRKGFNRVVVVAGVQAPADATSAVASLGRAFVGLVGGEVLVVDASSSPAAGFDAACKSHGFTSLIDGTRRLKDVIESTATPGLTLIRGGLAKGEAQAVDETAVEQLIRESRAGFACTLVSGGEWDSPHLPLLAGAADGFYLVIRANRTDRDTAKRAVQFFDRAGVNIRGCILAGVTP